ncbi:MULTISPECIES: transglutaminase-like domain-containing protein [Bacillaceae]|uniref:DUF3488 and transglutaminase-like domain-containing protein n=1 Tax=Evansella alkalicola TaxID=745819 RepID=A0ABS6K0Z3_9BACI|nr:MULTISPECIES: transglutaminase domain-containing protein [Bacillaceae]MBU9723599.1 DUF3488 and transglutaminase-like domain-containing protein [Bacillus alkalicola]
MKQQKDWLERSVIFLTGVFLYSFYIWLTDYWLSVTEQIILTTLIVICITDMFLQLKPFYRRCVQALFILLFMGYFLEWRLVLPDPFYWRGLGESLWTFILDGAILFPYIWFATGTWLIYEFFIYWFQHKYRAMITMLIATVFLTTVDTYGGHELTTHIVIMICASLSLLVVHHFIMLKKKSPEGYDHLKDYPGTVILPITIFFTAVLIVTVFTPDTIRPLLTDPYTAWKNYQGEETSIRLPEQLGELGIDSGEKVSGYGRDDSELGGGFRFDQSLVMTVDTADPTYYRGEVRYHYTGNGWEGVDPDYHYSAYNFFSVEEEGVSTLENESRPIDNSLLKTKNISQTFSIPENSPYSSQVILGAYAIQSLSLNDMDREDNLNTHDNAVLELINFPYSEISEADNESPFLWLPNVEEMHFVGAPGSFPKNFTIYSKVPVIEEEKLREVNNLFEHEEYWDKYLQLPELSPRIIELVEQVVEDADNDYDKVKAIETYLRENFEYTTEPDEDNSESVDFVERFLFEVKEGYCDYFSTAMVVMTRTLDIPTRWVKGFTQGSRREEDYLYMDIAPGDYGVYEVRNSNAHSWVEVYFEGYGWIPFEPTPAFSIPSIYLDDGDNQSENRDADREVQEGGTEDGFNISENLLIVARIMITGLIGVLIILTTFILLRRKGLLRLFIWRRKNPDTYNQHIVFRMEKFLSYAKRHGYKYYDNQTLKEAFHDWTKINKDNNISKLLKDVLIMFESAKYSDVSLNKRDEEAFKEKLDILKKLLKK